MDDEAIKALSSKKLKRIQADIAQGIDPVLDLIARRVNRRLNALNDSTRIKLVPNQCGESRSFIFARTDVKGRRPEIIQNLSFVVAELACDWFGACPSDWNDEFCRQVVNVLRSVLADFRLSTDGVDNLVLELKKR